MITYYFIKGLVIIGSVMIVAIAIFMPWHACYEFFYKKNLEFNPIIAMICAMLCLMQVLVALDWMIFGYVKECC